MRKLNDRAEQFMRPSDDPQMENVFEEIERKIREYHGSLRALNLAICAYDHPDD